MYAAAVYFVQKDFGDRVFIHSLLAGGQEAVPGDACLLPAVESAIAEGLAKGDSSAALLSEGVVIYLDSFAANTDLSVHPSCSFLHRPNPSYVPKKKKLFQLQSYTAWCLLSSSSCTEQGGKVAFDLPSLCVLSLEGLFFQGPCLLEH